MTNTDTRSVAEALKMGLSISIRSLTGDRIVIKTSRVYKNAKRKALSQEYTITQSVLPDAQYTTNVAEEIAAMGINLAGKSLASEARRLVANFIAKRPATVN